MKGGFYDDIPAIQAAVTEVLKNIPINDIKKSMHALVDLPNIVLSLMEPILNK